MKSEFSEADYQQHQQRISDKMAAAGPEDFDVEEMLEAPYKKEVSVYVLADKENELYGFFFVGFLFSFVVSLGTAETDHGTSRLS